MITIFLQASQPDSMMPTLLMMGAMFVGFYFLMIRPQMRKQKQEKNFQDNLKVGSRVVTTSGLHGRIAQIQDDGVVIETLSGKLKFAFSPFFNFAFIKFTGLKVEAGPFSPL